MHGYLQIPVYAILFAIHSYVVSIYLHNPNEINLIFAMSSVFSMGMFNADIFLTYIRADFKTTIGALIFIAYTHADLVPAEFSLTLLSLLATYAIYCVYGNLYADMDDATHI